MVPLAAPRSVLGSIRPLTIPTELHILAVAAVAAVLSTEVVAVRVVVTGVALTTVREGHRGLQGLTEVIAPPLVRMARITT